MTASEIAAKLETILRLNTRPTAVTFYKDRKDLPRHPGNMKQNFCQLVSMARYAGREGSSVPDKMICAMGAACLGLIATPEVFTSGKAAVGVYSKDEKAARSFMANTFKVGDSGKQYDAVLVEALESAEKDPDVVVIYCNPAQVMRLIHACAYETGGKVTADTVAEAAMCSSVGYAMATQKPVVGFPCAGDRIFGGTQNEEVVFAAPYAMFEKTLINALEKTAEGGFSVFPIPPNMYWTPVMPDSYTIQPEYLK